MNKKVQKFLAGVLVASTATGTGYIVGQSLINSGIDNNFFKDILRTNDLETDSEVSPENNIDESFVCGSDTESRTRTVDTFPIETHSYVESEFVETEPAEIMPEDPLPIESESNTYDYDWFEPFPIETDEPVIYPELTLTGNSNTKNDNLERGKICINNTDFVLPDDIDANLHNAIKSIENLGLNVGFYLTDPETNMTISYNGNKDFQTASTIKAGMVLYAVKEIEKGHYSFDDKMTYESKHYCGGSGNIQYSNFGTEYTLRDVLHKTISISDNIGYYMLLDKFGHEGYNDMITDLGCKNTLSNWVKWGNLTPQELNLIWQEIYAYSKSSEEGAWLFNEFLNAEYNFIKTCLPEYTSAHKSGFNPQGYHDSAVVFGDRTYIITIMTTQSWWTHENMDKIAEALDDAIKSYNQYLINQNSDEYYMGN